MLHEGTSVSNPSLSSIYGGIKLAVLNFMEQLGKVARDALMLPTPLQWGGGESLSPRSWLGGRSLNPATVFLMRLRLKA